MTTPAIIPNSPAPPPPSDEAAARVAAGETPPAIGVRFGTKPTLLLIVPNAEAERVRFSSETVELGGLLYQPVPFFKFVDVSMFIARDTYDKNTPDVDEVLFGEETGAHFFVPSNASAADMLTAQRGIQAAFKRLLERLEPGSV